MKYWDNFRNNLLHGSLPKFFYSVRAVKRFIKLNRERKNIEQWVKVT